MKPHDDIFLNPSDGRSDAFALTAAMIGPGAFDQHQNALYDTNASNALGSLPLQTKQRYMRQNYRFSPGCWQCI